MGAVSPPAPLVAVPRRWAAVLAGLTAITLALAHLGLASLLAAVILMAVVVSPDGRGGGRWFLDVLAWVPIAAVLLLAVVLLVSIPVGLAGIELWSRSAAVPTWVALIVGLTALGTARGGRVAFFSWYSGLAWLPAALLAAVQAWRHAQPFSAWSRPVWNGTDWINHADMVLDLRTRGLLDYRLPTPNSVDVPDIYPRGLHALLAWVAQVSTAPSTPFQAWESTLFTLSLVAAGLAVLGVAAASLVSIALVLRLRGPRWLAIVASLLTALAFAVPKVYDLLFWSGFVTTAGIVVALFALVLVAACGSEHWGFAARVVLSLLLTIAAFNLWQLMAFPFVVVDAYLAWRWWRSGRRHAAWVVVTVLACAAGCLPLGVHTFTSFAVRHALTAGGFATFPLGYTILSGGLAIVVLFVATRSHPMPPVVMVLGLAIVSTLALGLGLVVYTDSPLDEISYYPAKVLWHATILALPAVVASLGYLAYRAWGIRWFGEHGSRGRVVRLLAVGAPVTLAFAFFGGSVSPALGYSMSQLGAPGGESPQVAMIVAEQPEVLGAEGRPVLVWRIHPQGWQFWAGFDDLHATLIARSLGHPVPQLQSVATHQVKRICDWLTTHPDAVRITGPRHGEDDLIAGGCPVDVVRPDDWQVVTTPAAWWLGTRWQATGGAMDPSLVDLGRLGGRPGSSVDTPANTQP
jgi:hypothetical protein